jgi:hypothetical protein
VSGAPWLRSRSPLDRTAALAQYSSSEETYRIEPIAIVLVIEGSRSSTSTITSTSTTASATFS